MVIKAEAILVAGEWFETYDRFLVDIDVEEAPLGPDGDVVVAAIGTDRGGQNVRSVTSPGRLPARRLVACMEAPMRYGQRPVRLERIAGETPTEGVRPLVPRGNEAEKRDAQLGHGVEVAVSQTLTMHDAEE